MLIRIYIGFSIASFLILQVISWAVSCELKDRYGTSKIKDQSFPRKILSELSAILVCIIPIWHIIMMLIMIFKYNDVIEGTIEATKDNLDIEGD